MRQAQGRGACLQATMLAHLQPSAVGAHNLALQHLADKGPEHNLGWRSRLRRRVGGRLCLCCRPATQAHHAEGDSVQRRALQRVDGAALHVKYLVQGDAQAQVGDNLGPPVWWASQ